MDAFESAKQYFLQGLDFFAQEKFSEAEDRFEKSLQVIPDRVSTLTNLSATKIRLKRFAEGKVLASRAIALDQKNSEAYLNLGLVEVEFKNENGALEYFDKAIELKPDFAEAWSNKGATLNALQRHDEALAHYDKAIALKPDYAEAWSNKGVTLNNLRRGDEALAHYDKAIALRPDYAEAWSNKGVTLHDLQRCDEALAHCDKAIALKPDYAKAWLNKGVTCFELKRYDEALTHYDQATRLNPDLDFLLGQAAYTRMKVCDWSEYHAQTENIIASVTRGEKVSTPFSVLAISASEAINLKAAEIWVKEKCPPGNAEVVFNNKNANPRKIRLGYFSSDYHDHAMSYLMAGFYELHDKNRFELIAFSLGPDKNDDSRRRVVAAFDRFIDVRNKSDREVAGLSRNLGVDIAVDLNGYTQNARSGIFSYRAAPIQVNYLGYPGTMGAAFIDYIVADKTIIPASNQSFFSEKIVYLPNCYQVNDARRSISDKRYTRLELGLPETGFVFCCFNNNHKITPATFDSWMRILKQVDSSVLWLFEDNPTAARNLRKEAVKRGILADRLIFAGVMNLPEHLARHRAADLFIDTLPYSAHTTASDALWSGVPLLTLQGDTFAGRVASSLLNAVGLPELITKTREEYEALAIHLAIAPDKLNQIRQKLANNRLTTPLFDTQLSTRHIEAAYTEMYRRYRSNLSPDHIYIQGQ